MSQLEAASPSFCSPLAPGPGDPALAWSSRCSAYSCLPKADTPVGPSWVLCSHLLCPIYSCYLCGHFSCQHPSPKHCVSNKAWEKFPLDVSTGIGLCPISVCLQPGWVLSRLAHLSHVFCWRCHHSLSLSPDSAQSPLMAPPLLPMLGPPPCHSFPPSCVSSPHGLCGHCRCCPSSLELGSRLSPKPSCPCSAL